MRGRLRCSGEGYATSRESSAQLTSQSGFALEYHVFQYEFCFDDRVLYFKSENGLFVSGLNCPLARKIEANDTVVRLDEGDIDGGNSVLSVLKQDGRVSYHRLHGPCGIDLSEQGMANDRNNNCILQLGIRIFRDGKTCLCFAYRFRRLPQDNDGPRWQS